MSKKNVKKLSPEDIYIQDIIDTSSHKEAVDLLQNHLDVQRAKRRAIADKIKELERSKPKNYIGTEEEWEIENLKEDIKNESSFIQINEGKLKDLDSKFAQKEENKSQEKQQPKRESIWKKFANAISYPFIKLGESFKKLADIISGKKKRENKPKLNQEKNEIASAEGEFLEGAKSENRPPLLSEAYSKMKPKKRSQEKPIDNWSAVDFTRQKEMEKIFKDRRRFQNDDDLSETSSVSTENSTDNENLKWILQLSTYDDTKPKLPSKVIANKNNKTTEQGIE